MNFHPWNLVSMCLNYAYFQVKSREVEMLALQEERHRREELERKLHEETQLREELVSQQIKYREKQKQQVY